MLFRIPAEMYTQSEACDHVTLTAGDDGKVMCRLVSSGGRIDKTFNKP